LTCALTCADNRADITPEELMRTTLRLSILWAAIALCAPLLAASLQAEAADTATVACRALEVHASAQPAVIAVVFHQRDKPDQARLASALRQHSGEGVEIQTGDGKWVSATVVRLKSCFGRGLLLLPADAPPIKDGATFLLRFSASPAASK
jgi:hypothetical protein